MTIGQWARKRLVDNGMFPGPAEQVMQKFTALVTETLGPDAYRLKEEVEGYPPQFLALLLGDLNMCAVEWIDANQPRAWYRAMFAGERKVPTDAPL